jgi:sugar phosphate isomerase/epimerase
MKKITRRDFVKTTSGAVVGGALVSAAPKMWGKATNLPMGIQLYTVREQLPKDFDGTLRQLHDDGFQEVEAAGYFGRTAAQFKQAMDNAGLHCVSAHHPLADLLAKEDELIQYGHDLGLSYIICSWARAKDPKQQELTLDDWKWDCEQFNRIGEKTRKAGIQFGYHNHVREFKKLDGMLIYDVLLHGTDPKLVTMEMDCGWVVAAGFNPIEYLNKYPKRFSMLHVKDMTAGPDPHSTVLGRGSIDYRPIFAAAKNIKHYFYEQEEFNNTPAQEAIKMSADYLKKLES